MVAFHRRPVELAVSTDWLLIAQLLYCIVIAVQKGIIIAALYVKWWHSTDAQLN